MKGYNYKKVNAFVSEHSKGNPAAYLVAEADLAPEEMLAIGKEHAGFVSEVVFCTPSKDADCKLTYYSSECEVDFCGHGTIAAMYDLIQENKTLFLKDKITIETNKKGILTVYNSIREEDAIYITAPEAQYLPVKASLEATAEALSLTKADIDTKHTIELIDAGLRTLIVPVLTLDTEIAVYPSLERAKEFCQTNDIDIILLYCMQTKQKDYFAHTRVFAPKFGYLEDTATGSGNSAFANYLLKNAMWDGSPIKLEQGAESFAFNTVQVKVQEGKVLFGGKAKVIIEGKYYM